MNSFIVALNPDEESTLPFLLFIPVDGGLVLKARDKGPATSRVYCHNVEDPWPADLEVAARNSV
ncbi:MAG: hypothetical protein ACRDIU_09445 [Actinomycetota bacterium]